LALVPQILHALAPSPEPTKAAAGAVEDIPDQEELERLVAVRHIYVLQGVVLYYRRLGLALGLPLPLKPPHCRDGPFTAKQRAVWPDCGGARPPGLSAGRVG
jgi:hypothetical protein